MQFSGEPIPSRFRGHDSKVFFEKSKGRCGRLDLPGVPPLGPEVQVRGHREGRGGHARRPEGGENEFQYCFRADFGPFCYLACSRLELSFFLLGEQGLDGAEMDLPPRLRGHPP